MGICCSSSSTTQENRPPILKLMHDFPILELDDGILLKIHSFVVNEIPTTYGSFPLGKIFPYVCKKFATLVTKDENLWKQALEQVMRDNWYWEPCLQDFIDKNSNDQKEKRDDDDQDQDENDDGNNPPPKNNNNAPVVVYHPTKSIDEERIQELITKACNCLVVVMGEGKTTTSMEASTNNRIRELFKYLTKEYWPWNPPCIRRWPPTTQED